MAGQKVTNQRPDIEDFLVSRNITFEYVSGLSASRFDRERSLRNQARLGVPLNKEVVKRYAEAIEGGDRMPPVLAHEERDKLVILDGNHRLNASIEAGAPLDAYICSGSAQMLMLLTFEANAKHGLPSSEEDRLHHALFLVDNGVSEREAATRLQVPRAALARASLQQRANRRADDAGILRTQWEALPVSTRNRLAGINTDEGFKAAVELARDARLTTEEVQAIVTSLNETRSGARQARMVESVRDGMKARIAESVLTGTGKRGGSPQSRLAMAVGQMIGLPEPDRFAAEVPEMQRPDLVKKLDEATERIAAIRKALT